MWGSQVEAVCHPKNLKMGHFMGQCLALEATPGQSSGANIFFVEDVAYQKAAVTRLASGRSDETHDR